MRKNSVADSFRACPASHLRRPECETQSTQRRGKLNAHRWAQRRLAYMLGDLDATMAVFRRDVASSMSDGKSEGEAVKWPAGGPRSASRGRDQRVSISSLLRHRGALDRATLARGVLGWFAFAFAGALWCSSGAITASPGAMDGGGHGTASRATRAWMIWMRAAPSIRRWTVAALPAQEPAHGRKLIKRFHDRIIHGLAARPRRIGAGSTCPFKFVERRAWHIVAKGRAAGERIAQERRC